MNETSANPTSSWAGCVLCRCVSVVGENYTHVNVERASKTYSDDQNDVWAGGRVGGGCHVGQEDQQDQAARGHRKDGGSEKEMACRKCEMATPMIAKSISRILAL